MSDIYLDIPQMTKRTVNMQELIDHMDSLADEVTKLSFGKNGDHMSTGPCSEALQVLNAELYSLKKQWSKQ